MPPCSGLLEQSDLYENLKKLLLPEEKLISWTYETQIPSMHMCVPVCVYAHMEYMYDECFLISYCYLYAPIYSEGILYE